MENKKDKRRSGLRIMMELIGLVKPLLFIMVLAVVFGVLGFLCAIFLSILAGQALLNILGINSLGIISGLSLESLFFLIIGIGVLRGFLHYIEQYCNHYIAFKLLALIRHKVFAALRRLSPAKLEGRDRGNLISLITSDVELLEVFYAHTISPILIAIFTCGLMVIFISTYSLAAGIFALLAYITIGFIIPVINGRRGKNIGMEYRDKFGDLNSFTLETLRGLDEILGYNYSKERRRLMNDKADGLSLKQESLSGIMAKERVSTSISILVFSMGMLLLTSKLYIGGSLTLESVIIPTIAMMGSFGPVVALSSLSNNLNQTLASGERVLALLEEEPIIGEIPANQHSGLNFEDLRAARISFSYGGDKIIDDFSLRLEKNDILGIYGPSGSGKSTLLKLFMRFWDIDSGKLTLSNVDIDQIPTDRLRDLETYVTQETHLFQGTIADNIRIARLDAGMDEVIEAAKKASIHDFISQLPSAYETQVGELGDRLSGGERQRIGIARAFLHDAPLILLDEPTSNLDSLNEGIILKSLNDFAKDKTVVLVSHRKSTMSIAKNIFEMEMSEERGRK